MDPRRGLYRPGTRPWGPRYVTWGMQRSGQIREAGEKLAFCLRHSADGPSSVRGPALAQ